MRWRLLSSSQKNKPLVFPALAIIKEMFLGDCRFFDNSAHHACYALWGNCRRDFRMSKRSENANQAGSNKGLTEDGKDKFVSVEDLPNNPLEMPPPYWRSTSAVFHVVEALAAIIKHLPHLKTVIAKTDKKLDKYYQKYPMEGAEKDDQVLEEFSVICDELWGLEHRIRLQSERAILMSAIAIEDEMNQFCVFNLSKDIAETIEKLSLPEKLIVASSVLGKDGVKGTAVYEKGKKLTSWRNAFAHGHCVDRPVKSLRHNHLISPAEYPGVPSAIQDLVELVTSFIAISRYLNSISVNAYTASGSYEIAETGKILFRISQFLIVGSESIYTINRISKKKSSKR
jgi:hypothetical protein